MSIKKANCIDIPEGKNQTLLFCRLKLGNNVVSLITFLCESLIYIIHIVIFKNI